MGFKDLSYSMKGGIIGLIFSLIIGLVFYLTVPSLNVEDSFLVIFYFIAFFFMTFSFGEFFGIFSQSNSVWFPLSFNLVGFFFFVLTYILVGALIGWIFGKIKNRR